MTAKKAIHGLAVSVLFSLSPLSLGFVGISAAHAQTAGAADADLAPVPASEAGYGTTVPVPASSAAAPATAAPASAPAPAPAAPVATTDAAGQGYDQKAVIAEAQGFFGKGAEGVAGIIEKIFADLGRPNAYITGREASGAFIVGLRYGNGTLYHSVEGQKPVHWTGPSLGIDLGGDASKTFTLVYNLYDTEEIYRRYPAVEGKVYVIGGFTANYHQRDNIILVPIKLGVGWRLGANIGYLKYSKEGRVIPF